jgi:hypothetical protein
MVGDAVDFEIVDAPSGVLLEQGVVPGLAGGSVADAPVCEVPWAGVRFVGDVLGMEAAAGDREVSRDGLAGDSADDVNAELETERMDLRTQRREAGVATTAEGRGEARGNGDIAAVCVELVGEVLGCGALQGILEKPALVDDGVVPAEGLERFGEDGDVFAELRLCDGEALGVPTVPAHRRCGRERGCFGSLGGSVSGECHR